VKACGEGASGVLTASILVGRGGLRRGSLTMAIAAGRFVGGRRKRYTGFGSRCCRSAIRRHRALAAVRHRQPAPGGSRTARRQRLPVPPAREPHLDAGVDGVCAVHDRLGDGGELEGVCRQSNWVLLTIGAAVFSLELVILGLAVRVFVRGRERPGAPEVEPGA